MYFVDISRFLERYTELQTLLVQGTEHRLILNQLGNLVKRKRMNLLKHYFYSKSDLAKPVNNFSTLI